MAFTARSAPGRWARPLVAVAALIVPIGPAQSLVLRAGSDAATAPIASGPPVGFGTPTAPESTETADPPATVAETPDASPPVEKAPAPASPPPTDSAADRLALLRLRGVEAIADTTRFDWRAAGVTIHIGYNVDDCCHWGIYDYRDNSLWIGPPAFAYRTRLRYVVLHELGHAWQWASGQRGRLADDMEPWGYAGNDALERSADCLASLWGAPAGHYWSCPTEAQMLLGRRLAGDWTRAAPESAQIDARS